MRAGPHKRANSPFALFARARCEFNMDPRVHMRRATCERLLHFSRDVS